MRKVYVLSRFFGGGGGVEEFFSSFCLECSLVYFVIMFVDCKCVIFYRIRGVNSIGGCWFGCLEFKSLYKMLIGYYRNKY